MTLSYKTWHRTYCRWYDHREADHTVRAAVWGWLADRVVNAADLAIRAGLAR